MPSFIPTPIQLSLKSQNYRGSLQCYSMFIDLRGFTALMTKGKEGCEILTDTINALFTPAIEAIEAHGGFIASFAGDSFTAIFPKREATILDVFTAAIQIRNFFISNRHQQTDLGNYEVTVRVGIGIGEVNWRIIPAKPQAVYWYYGDSIDNAVQAEQHASHNTIALSSELLQATNMINQVELRPLEDGFHELINCSVIAPERKLDYRPVNNARFVPKSILSLTTQGEFREVLACFINLKKIDSRRIEWLLTLANEFGGYFNKVDCSDKGCVVLVLFGAPTTLEKMSIRALEFAMAVREKLGDSTRVGLSIGTAFSGIVGSKNRGEYTALGMSVNLAARYMMKAKWGEVLFDHHIQAEVTNRLQNTELGEFVFKGFHNPIQVFRAEQLNQSLTRPRYPTRMVGREVELQQLVDSSESIWAKHKFAGVTYVYGEAGQGKTRLIYEFAKRIEPRAEIITLPTDSILCKPLNPFVEWIRSSFTSSKIGPIEVQRSEFRYRWLEFIRQVLIINASLEAELYRIESIIAGVVGLEWEDSIYANVVPKDRPSVVRFALKSLLQAFCQLQPIVLVLEDLHWLDDESKAVFTILTRQAESLPFKLLVTSRYTDEGDKPVLKLDDDVNVTVIDLNALASTQITQFSERLLQSKIDDSLASYLFTRSQGNPFFCEQIALYLQQTQQLTPVDQQLTLTETATTLPAGIQAVLVARIDRLPAELKEVVHTASVLGREFTIPVLQEVLQTLHSKQKNINTLLTQHLLAGEQEHIWNGAHERRYLFNHILLRDAAYEMQLKKHLRKLHQIAADTMVRLYADNPQQWLEIATHFDQADDWESAVTYYHKAGKFEQDQFHFSKALEAYQRGLELNRIHCGVCHPDTANSYNYIGEVARSKGEYDKALENYLTASDIKLAVHGDLNPETAVSYEKIGLAYSNKGETDQALKYHQKALQIRMSVFGEQHLETASSLNSIGNVYRNLGEYEQAKEYLAKSLSIRLILLGEQNIQVAASYNNLGSLLNNCGEYELALTYYQKALSIKEAILGERHPSNTSLYNNLGALYVNRHEFELGLIQFQNVLDIQLAVLGDQHPETAITYSNMSAVYGRKGEFDRSLEYCRISLMIRIKVLGERHPATAISYNQFGSLLRNKGDNEQALFYLQKALEIQQEVLGEKHPDIAASYNNIGNLYKYVENYERALEYHLKALEIRSVVHGDRHPSTATTFINIGSVYFEVGDLEKALAYHLQALEIRIAIQGEHHPATHNVLNNICEIYEKSGELDKAERYRKRMVSSNGQST